MQSDLKKKCWPKKMKKSLNSIIQFFKQRWLSDFRWTLTLIEWSWFLVPTYIFLTVDFLDNKALNISVFKALVAGLNVCYLSVLIVFLIEQSIGSTDKGIKVNPIKLIDGWRDNILFLSVFNIVSLCVDYPAVNEWKLLTLIFVFYVIFGSLAFLFELYGKTHRLVWNGIIEACRTGDTELLSAMLKKLPSVYAVSAYNESPFTIAVDSGNLKMMEFLLDKGVDPEHDDDNGITALSYVLIVKRDMDLYSHIQQRGKAAKERLALDNLIMVDEQIESDGLHF